MIEALALRRRWMEAAALLDAEVFASDPSGASVPAERAPLVAAILDEAGRFDDARRFVLGHPAFDDATRARDARRREELLRVLGPAATGIVFAGDVRTVAPERRLDAGLVLGAVHRMRARLGVSWELPAEIEVEVHAEVGPRVQTLLGLRWEPRGLLGCAVWRPAGASHILVALGGDGTGVGGFLLHQRIRHEVVHLAVRETSGGRLAPAWLDEGLAMVLTMNLPRRLAGATVELARLPALRASIPVGQQEGPALAAAFGAASALLGRLGTAGVAHGLASGWADDRWEREAAG